MGEQIDRFLDANFNLSSLSQLESCYLTAQDPMNECAGVDGFGEGWHQTMRQWQTGCISLPRPSTIFFKGDNTNVHLSLLFEIVLYFRDAFRGLQKTSPALAVAFKSCVQLRRMP